MKRAKKQQKVDPWFYVIEYSLLAVIFLGILCAGLFVRSIPEALPITDKWAEQSIANQLGVAEVNGYEIQIAELSYRFKEEFRDDNEQSYLMAITPYLYLRYAQEISDKGFVGDGRVDTLSAAPVGSKLQSDQLNAYVINAISSDPVKGMYTVPLYLFAFCCIGIFLLARRLGGNVAAILSAMLFSLGPALLTRNVVGFFDPMFYTIGFVAFSLWLLYEAVAAKNKVLSAVCALFAALCTGLIAFSNAKAVFLIHPIIISAVAILLYTLVVDAINKSFEKSKQLSLILIPFIVLSYLLVALWGGFETVEVSSSLWPTAANTIAENNTLSLDNLVSNMGGVVLFVALMLSFFYLFMRKEHAEGIDLIIDASIYGLAGVFATVIGFLIHLQMQELFNTLFIVFAILVGIGGICICILKKRYDLPVAYFLLVPVSISTLFFANSIPTSMLLFLPLCLAFGLMATGIMRLLSSSYDYTTKKRKWHYIVKKGILAAIGTILIFTMSFAFVQAPLSFTIAQTNIPSMNDAWYDSLVEVKENSKEDAIVTTWWDFGHWISAVAQRGVSIDAKTNTGAQLYWVSRFFTTSDEKEALGILRMLNCGGNSAFEAISKEKTEYESIRIIDELVRLEKFEAKNRLNGLGLEGSILEKTHCDPPESFVIVSDDMVGKSGVWAHFGSWDFDRSLAYNILQEDQYRNNEEKSVNYFSEEFEIPKEEAETLFLEATALRDDQEAGSWIAPWPSFAQPAACRTVSEKTVACPIRAGYGTAIMNVDTEEFSAEIVSGQETYYPDVLVIPTESGIEKKEYSENTIGNSVLMMNNQGQWSFILTKSPLEESMFAKLYFLDGTDHFEKVSQRSSAIGEEIIIWKVVW